MTRSTRTIIVILGGGSRMPCMRMGFYSRPFLCKNNFVPNKNYSSRFKKNSNTENILKLIL